MSAHFSGDGFPGMHFKAHVLPPEQFAAWAQGAKGQGGALDGRAYAVLSKPSSDVKPADVRRGRAAAVRRDRRRKDTYADAAAQSAKHRAGGLRMFGKLSWDAIPLP